MPPDRESSVTGFVTGLHLEILPVILPVAFHEYLFISPCFCDLLKESLNFIWRLILPRHITDMMTLQLPDNSPLNKDLIAWSDIEIYSNTQHKDYCKRRVIFYQDGIWFRSHVEYLNDDNTRRCLEHGEYDTCITVAYYNLQKKQIA